MRLRTTDDQPKDRAMPPLRTAALPPSGPSRCASWAKPAAAIAGQAFVLLFILFFCVALPALFGGS